MKPQQKINMAGLETAFKNIADALRENPAQDPGVSSRRPNFYVYDKTLPEYEGIEIAP